MQLNKLKCTIYRYTDEGHIIDSSKLTVTLRDKADFGIYSCVVRNSTAQFNVQEYSKKKHLYLNTWIGQYGNCIVFVLQFQYGDFNVEKYVKKMIGADRGSLEICWAFWWILLSFFMLKIYTYKIYLKYVYNKSYILIPVLHNP